MNLPEVLPVRNGQRPRTTRSNPHEQLDQQPDSPLTEALLSLARRLPHVHLAPSFRAPAGTVGLHVEERSGLGPSEAFLLGSEFAHAHPGPDHSWHLALPQSLKSWAIAAGWAELHPLAGRPTVSPHTVLLYAPRDAAELEVASFLLQGSWAFARGLFAQAHPTPHPVLESA